MLYRPTVTVICAAVAASAASLWLALAPALLPAPAAPLNGLRVVELPRVVISGVREARRVELPRVVIEGRRSSAAVAVAGSRSGAQPVMSRRGE